MATNILAAVNDIARIAKLTSDANTANAEQALDLNAKKELIAIATAVNAAAAKGDTTLNYSLTSAITSLTDLNLEYALALIEDDMTAAEYEFTRILKKDKITGYAIEWTEHVVNFNELVNVLQNNNKVVLTLTSDAEVNEPIVISKGKTAIIDLNATITSTATSGIPAVLYANGGKLILRGNGTINSAVAVAGSNNGGEVVIESGNYTTTKGGQVVFATNGSTATINGGTFHGQEFAAMPLLGSTMIINGGEFTTNDNVVIGTNGTVSDTKGDYGHNTLVIMNAVFNSNIQSTGYAACGVYAANSDDITIENTTINVHNGVGICQRAGNVTIGKNVVINVTADEEFEGGWVGDKKRVIGLDGIAYLPADNYPGAQSGMSLTIADGTTINAIDHAIYTDPIDATITVGEGNYTPKYTAL